MSIKLDLEVQEVNLVLSALAKQPYDMVQALIEKIKTQAIPQVPQENLTETNEA